MFLFIKGKLVFILLILLFLVAIALLTWYAIKHPDLEER